jgi:hypothetical protein
MGGTEAGGIEREGVRQRTPHILNFRAFRRLALEIRDRTAYPAAKPIRYGSAFKAAVQSSSISLR